MEAASPNAGRRGKPRLYGEGPGPKAAKTDRNGVTKLTEYGWIFLFHTGTWGAELQAERGHL
jgi:hypothetical protein